MAFNRSRGNDSGRGGFNRPRFGDRGPIEMHQATCDSCGKDCEVPFRPTNGKPVFCSTCFENQRGSDSRGSERGNYERPGSSEERQMFDAVCADCGNSCQVPFHPSGDKPVFCSDCFGAKKGAGDKNESPSGSRDQLEKLNIKLDKILLLLDPSSAAAVSEPIAEMTEATEPVEMEEVVEEVLDQQPEETVITEEETTPKKKPSKKS